jgi:deferrochelatase/peroxidase EfeB
LLDAPWIECSTILSNDAKRVHFDLVDGISSPQFVDLNPSPGTPAFNVHATGELLLGHPRNDGSNPWLLARARSQMQGALKPQAQPALAAYGQFFRDGSFGAFRKIRQDVDGLERWLEMQARQIQGAWSLEATVQWLKAKLVGRWPNGTLVDAAAGVPGASVPGNAPAQNLDNFFGFSADPAGLGCPVGSHIRRMNPRDDHVVPFLKRPLLRRGTPYGEPTDADRGLLGLFLCSSLEEQFEHVLGRWANDSPMGRPQGPTAKDPLIGNQDPLGSRYEIPTADGTLLLKPMQSFVQTLGTCYVFFPGKQAVHDIASGSIGSYTGLVKVHGQPA